MIAQSFGDRKLRGENMSKQIIVDERYYPDELRDESYQVVRSDSEYLIIKKDNTNCFNLLKKQEEEWVTIGWDWYLSKNWWVKDTKQELYRIVLEDTKRLDALWESRKKYLSPSDRVKFRRRKYEH
jgi:hypothetical protein